MFRVLNAVSFRRIFRFFWSVPKYDWNRFKIDSTDKIVTNWAGPRHIQLEWKFIEIEKKSPPAISYDMKTIVFKLR